MIPSIFGLAVILIGLILLYRSGVPGLLMFVLLCLLMGGSAAVYLPALGGSSIPPANLALGFLVVRLMMPGGGVIGDVRPAIRANLPLLLFAGYGVTAAFLLPRLFQGEIGVVPMRPPSVRDFEKVYPLAFSSQNVTAAVYLASTLLAGIGAYVAALRPGMPRLLVKTVVWAGGIHAFLGISGVLFAGTGYARFLGFFRNGAYSQLNQSYNGFVRMNGILPEASSYAGLGLIWFVFLVECWLRDVMPRRTGTVAAVLGLALIWSTSATAYVGLAIYAALFLVRSWIPGSLPARKGLLILATALIAGMAVSLLLAFNAPIAAKFADLVWHMTFDKADSRSGLQRAFWAQQGLHAFVASWGLGIGPGSFRSSSLPTAILGSTGVVGAMAFLTYVLRAFKPLRTSTYRRPANETQAVGTAASWTVLLSLLPASIMSPTPDPGLIFAIFAGVAIALREAAYLRPAPVLQGRHLTGAPIRVPRHRRSSRALSLARTR